MYFFIGCYVFILIFNVIKGKKAMHMLQQNLYNENNRYIKWVDQNLKTAFFHFDIVVAFLFGIAMIIHNEYSNLIVLICLLFYIIDDD